jgi:YfiH family protein
MSILADAEHVDDLTAYGVRAFTTTRSAGTFGLGGTEPVRDVMGRWAQLRRELQPDGSRLASATQVHGRRVVVHDGDWEGWLRADEADGHATARQGTAIAVTIADCVPVFIAHPAGAIALLHSGWRGTVARIVEQGIAALAHRGFPPGELRIHLGPAICGRCYEVSPDVYRQLTNASVTQPSPVDLRAIIAEHARDAGATHITTSPHCTRCDNARYFSHRAGDAGRQLAVLMLCA